jgi:hypothetical protein
MVYQEERDCPSLPCAVQNSRFYYLDSTQHRLVYFSKHNVSETGFCLRLQVKPTQLGPIDRANPYLRTPVPAPRWGIPSQAQRKPSARAKKTLIF